jgi:DMSO/TMAO reductase YedYZ molybdopterin-dependent catalytic subunit
VSPAIELVGLEGTTQSLTMDELQAMPAREAWGGFMTSTGDIHAPAQMAGVPLADLAEMAGALEPGTGVRVVAEDGYAMTLSYDQIANGDFIAYDPATGEETTADSPLELIVAYARDGEPLSAEREGTLRLAIVSDDQMQVTDGHWWVKWVDQIVLISMTQDWSLHLEGAIADDVDRNTFESCSAASCHQATWTDDHAQVWTGTPLWLVVGRVDDERMHEDPAFNRELADQGYTVELVAADGYSVEFDIERIRENNDIIVAHLVNDNPLDEESFPLRLVGPDLQGNERIAQIAEILLHLPEETEPAEGEGALTITGAVEESMTWSMEDLEGMEVVEITAEHPNRGTQTYTGVRILALLDLVGVEDGTTTLAVTAADDYTSEIPLADVLACADCLVAFDEGSLRLAMPGFTAGSAWVKDVVQIEVR